MGRTEAEETTGCFEELVVIKVPGVRKMVIVLVDIFKIMILSNQVKAVSNQGRIASCNVIGPNGH